MCGETNLVVFADANARSPIGDGTWFGDFAFTRQAVATHFCGLLHMKFRFGLHLPFLNVPAMWRRQ
eukprot:8612388-Karenia_brevis.AAC.1